VTRAGIGAMAKPAVAAEQVNTGPQNEKEMVMYRGKMQPCGKGTELSKLSINKKKLVTILREHESDCVHKNAFL